MIKKTIIMIFLMISIARAIEINNDNIHISRVEINKPAVCYLDTHQEGIIYADNFCYNNETCITTSSSSNGTGYTLNEISANIGNFSAEKSNYNTTSELNNLYYSILNPNNYINVSNLEDYAKYNYGDNSFNGTGNYTTSSDIKSSRYLNYYNSSYGIYGNSTDLIIGYIGNLS